MSINIHPQYITDDNGERISVIISMEEFESILGDLHNLPTSIPFDENHNDIPLYPTISFREAEEKVQKSISNISKNTGKALDTVFNELLS